MVRRRRQRGRGIGFVIVLGVLGGVLTAVYNGWLALPAGISLSLAVAPPSGSAMHEPLLPTTIPTLEATPQVRGNRLIIPTIGVNAPIVDLPLTDTSWDVSRLGALSVGHLTGTAALEAGGNRVLVGHVEMPDGTGGVFRTLRDLQIGQPVILSIDGHEHWYRLSETVTVAFNDLQPLHPSPQDRLTLMTCDDYDFLSGQYQSRLIAIADPLV